MTKPAAKAYKVNSIIRPSVPERETSTPDSGPSSDVPIGQPMAPPGGGEPDVLADFGGEVPAYGEHEGLAETLAGMKFITSSIFAGISPISR